MRAFVVEHYGSDGLRAADVPEPEVGAADVLIRVSAAGINPLDKRSETASSSGSLKHRTPFVLGHDIAERQRRRAVLPGGRSTCQARESSGEPWPAEYAP